MNICMYACMYCMHIYVCACIYVYMHVYIHVCMYVILKLDLSGTGGNCPSWERELSGGELSGGNYPGGNVRSPYPEFL